MKKTLVILLILVLVASLFMFVACNGNGNEKTKIIVKVPALGMDLTDMDGVNNGISTVADYLKRMANFYMASHSNVEIEIAEYEAAKEQQFVEDTIGTSSAPDVLFDSFYNMRSYIYTGEVVPVTDVVNAIQNKSNVVKVANNVYNGLTFNEDALKAAEISANSYYMLPLFSQQYVFAYNLDLLNAVLSNTNAITEFGANAAFSSLKAKIPASDSAGKEKARTTVLDFTGDEWDMALKLLSKYGKQVNTYSYAMMMYGLNTQGDSHIYTMLMNHGATIYSDSAASIDMNNANTINALKRFINSNKSGYYTNNAENMDINDCIDLFLNGQLGFCVCNNALYNQYKDSSTKQGRSVNFGLVNFRGNYCENYYYGFEVFDNGSTEKIAAAKDFVKFIYNGVDPDKTQKENIRYSACAVSAIEEVETEYAKNDYNFHNGFKTNAEQHALGENGDTYKAIAGTVTNWNAARRIINVEFRALLKGSYEINSGATQEAKIQLAAQTIASTINSKYSSYISNNSAKTPHK